MTKARDIASAAPAPSTVDATEIGYLNGVTSAIQTQIDSKIGSASAINPTIVDAKGDIIAATAADTVAKLTVGANGTVLTAASGQATGLEWATPASPSFVGCLAYTSNQSITFTANVATVITMGNEEFDTDGFHSTSTNTSRITIPSGKGGKYLLTAQWDIQGGGINAYYMSYLKKNGSAISNGVNRGGAGNLGDNAFWGKSFATIVDLVATDYIEFFYQTDYSSATNFWLRFGATYLGA